MDNIPEIVAMFMINSGVAIPSSEGLRILIQGMPEAEITSPTKIKEFYDQIGKLTDPEGSGIDSLRPIARR